MNVKCDTCSQKYLVADDFLGKNFTCSNCGCMVRTPKRPPVAERLKDDTSTVWLMGILLFSAVAVHLFSNMFLYIYLPLYAASFALAVLLLLKKRILAGTLNIVLLLTVPVLIFFYNITFGSNYIENLITLDARYELLASKAPPIPSVKPVAHYANPSTPLLLSANYVYPRSENSGK